LDGATGRGDGLAVFERELILAPARAKAQKGLRENDRKRVRAFRLGLVKLIPKFPNNKASAQSLEQKSLGSLLIDYANWAIRYVAPRPRKVIVEPTASMDPRWVFLKRDIDAFLQKVERGEDLTPNLSLVPHKRGFTPAASAPGPAVDRWADKDMLLNVMGYHHFHPRRTITPAGFPWRADEVLFAYVTRNEFTVVGVFDHSVFKSEPGQSLTLERERLWQIFDERLTRHAPPGSVVVAPPIATSGHSVDFTYLAMKYARLISNMDQRLDDPGYISDLTAGTGFQLPTNPKWKWHLQYLDLGLFEKMSNAFLVLRKGPN
jgi:hypothetical protein